MPPTIILIRHGQALHNVSHKILCLTRPAQDYDIPDPELTELGRQQCRTLEQHLRQNLPLADKVEAIITSPMHRTLETTVLGLDWLIKRGVPVEADALWQENSDKPCDTGSPLSRVQTIFPNIDYKTVDPLWPSKEGPYAFTRRATVARGHSCLRNLHQRKEKVIAVVSHSGFLRCAISHTQYANTDYRVFDFVEGEELELKEWDLTAQNGGGLGESEKGRAEIQDTDFPPEEQVEEVEEQFGEKTSGEAAKEVPETK